MVLQNLNMNLNCTIFFVGFVGFVVFVHSAPRWVSPGNGSVFRIIDAQTEIRSRNNAKSFCEGIGANLAIIKTRHENNVLHASTQGDLFHWIGLTRAANSNEYKWDDGTTPSFFPNTIEVGDLEKGANMMFNQGNWLEDPP